MDNILKNLLLQIVDDLDSGNSHLSELDQLKAIDFLQKLTSQELSKLESADYLGVSRATFDNYIKKGLIPEGRKRLGLKEKFWNKSDLDNFYK